MSGARELLVQTAESLFESYCDRATLDRSETGEWPQELWAAIEESGLQDALASEEHGGAGISFGDAMSVLRVAGRYAAPVGLAESLLAGWLCSVVDRKPPDGPIALLLATRKDDPFSLRQEGDSVVAQGHVGEVPFARFARNLVCITEEADAVWLVVFAADVVRIEESANLAGDARDTVHFDSAPVEPTSMVRLPAGVGSELVRARWALTRVAMMSGALEYLLSTSVEYARKRIQFGRPIGRFQAIQQQLAVLAGEVAAANAACGAAGEAADEGDAILESAIAKARVGEAAGLATRVAHQVHGAIGFTHEHDLHTRSRRLWAWRDEMGSEGESCAIVGRRFCAAGADALWAELTRDR